MTLKPKQRAQGIARIDIVFDNQNAKRTSFFFRLRRIRLRDRAGALASAGSRTVNSLPLPKPALTSLHAAPMHLHNGADQRQPDAEACVGPWFIDCVDLAKHFENVRKRLRRRFQSHCPERGPRLRPLLG